MLGAAMTQLNAYNPSCDVYFVSLPWIMEHNGDPVSQAAATALRVMLNFLGLMFMFKINALLYSPLPNVVAIFCSVSEYAVRTLLARIVDTYEKQRTTQQLYPEHEL